MEGKENDLEAMESQYKVRVCVRDSIRKRIFFMEHELKEYKGKNKAILDSTIRKMGIYSRIYTKGHSRKAREIVTYFTEIGNYLNEFNLPKEDKEEWANFFILPSQVFRRLLKPMKNI